MDPRVKTPVSDLQKQYDFSLQCYEESIHCKEIVNDIKGLRVKLKEKIKNVSSTEAEHLISLDKAVGLLENPQAGTGEPGFSRLGSSFASLLNLLQGTDQPPTEQAVAAIGETQKKFQQLKAKWNDLENHIAAEVRVVK